MARNTRAFRCTPEAVFRVLADGWLYPSWVVGASRMRDVDAAWPRPGARLLHSVGAWPLLLDDTTSCEVWEPPARVVLTARGWPIGEARVTLTVEEAGDGCLVRMSEEVLRGPARLLPRALVNLALSPRNAETLQRLAYLAEGEEARPRGGNDGVGHGAGDEAEYGAGDGPRHGADAETGRRVEDADAVSDAEARPGYPAPPREVNPADASLPSS